MRQLKAIAWIITALLLIASVYVFYPYLNLPKNVVQEIKQEIKNDTTAIIPEAKISAPLEQSEFEKTASYGEVSCKNYQSNVFTKDIVERINSDRVANGKLALKWNEQLCESAGLKSEDMNTNNYFEHISPSGVTPWHWIDQAGYKYTFVGENLALNYFTSESTHTALMNSPGHRANILNENFTEVGINYFRGKLNGEDAFFMVEHFASPAPEKPQIKYVCETDKAEKNLKKLKDTKDKIEKYLSDAEDIRKKIKTSGGDTKDVDAYIDNTKDKEKEVDKYIKEIQDYLKKCQG
jgi:uncharacterized protein YkwD